MRGVVLVVCVLVACERASPDPTNATTLDWIPTLPRMRIVVPPFVRAIAISDPPVVYMFWGGTLKKGLLLRLLVGRDKPGRPKDEATSRCDGVESVERASDRVIISCETPKGRWLEVTVGEMICMASWRRGDAPLDARQLEMARTIERTCSTLTILE